jgi:hypothetical protein
MGGAGNVTLSDLLQEASDVFSSASATKGMTKEKATKKLMSQVMKHSKKDLVRLLVEALDHLAPTA